MDATYKVQNSNVGVLRRFMGKIFCTGPAIAEAMADALDGLCDEAFNTTYELPFVVVTRDDSHRKVAVRIRVRPRHSADNFLDMLNHPETATETYEV